MSDPEDTAIIPCVGAIVRDEAGRLLVIRRRHDPSRGLWSLPGGRVEQGESAEDAVVREVAEETGLRVAIDAEIGAITIEAPAGGVYAVRDFSCHVLEGRLRAGDDAEDVRWVSETDLRSLDTSPGLIEVLTAWHVLPSPGNS